MIIAAIVAVDENGLMGLDNQIPWYLPADLKYFKKTTLHHPIVMGRKTFQSIGRPLPKRTNIVVTRDPFFAASGCLVVHGVEEALTMASDQGADQVFVIGGGEIYRQTKPYWDVLYQTVVHTRIEVQQDQQAVFFPSLEPERWSLRSATYHDSDDKNSFAYTFKIWEINQI